MNDKVTGNIDYINRILALTTKQQADIFKRAGFSDDEALQMVSEGAVNEKLKMLEREKTAVFARVTGELNNLLQKEQMMENARNLSNSLLKNQGNIYQQNENKLQMINSDIYTLRRQIIQGENQFKNYSNSIFYLKTIMVTLLLLLFVFILGRNSDAIGAIKNKLAVLILIGAMGIIFYQFWFNIGKDRIYFDMRNWRQK